MPLHRSFGHDPRPGFISSVDPRSARRQLNVSLAVMTALVVAIGSSAVALRPASGYDAASQRAHIADMEAGNHRALDASLRSGLPNGG